MAWCKASSLTAAASRALRDTRFPLSRAQVLDVVEGKNLEGWDLDYFLAKALKRKKYVDLREVMSDLETWLEAQG
jgi:hypothetical protein